jgi:oxygen-independent coproporphyrinogen-3 oxidase
VLPDEETDWLIRSTVYDRVAAAGYQRYEVSAFSQPNQHCQHNLNIWQFGDYLGIGAGAHGKVTTPEGVIRYTKERHPNRYMEKAVAGSALAQSRVILPDDLRFEFMLNALRLVDGFTPAKFTERTGLPRTFLDEQLDDAYQRGLLDTTEGRIRATEFGYRFLDDLVQLFLPKKILKL